MNKKEILEEFKLELKKFQKDIGFLTPLDELENEFSLQDSVLIAGFVKSDLFSQIGYAMVESFRNWAFYFNGLLIPGSQNFIAQTESKLFNNKEIREKIWKIISECMKFSNMYSYSNMDGDKKLKKEFIDSAYSSWKNTIKPFVLEVLEKNYNSWGDK